MKLGKVSGRIYSTIQHPSLQGARLLLVDLIDPDGSPTGPYIIALDAVDAGWRETVLICDEGNSARQVVQSDDAPVRSVVIGVVDEIQTAL